MPKPAAFPERLRALSPHAAERVDQLVPDLTERLREARRRAWSRPKRALDDYQEIAALLAPVVPEALPEFYEHAAREFVSARHGGFGARLLAAARQAEAEHGLDVDDDHVDAVFLEFALAGALPAKAVADYAKELDGRLPAGEAFQRYARVCVRRTEAGLAPSADMARAIRRLAKAAGDPAAREEAYLAELIALPPVIRAPGAWWSAHRSALTALARRDPAVRAALLGLAPGYHRDVPIEQSRAVFIEWLALLETSGATAALCGDSGGPEGGAAGWLDRVVRAWGTGLAGNVRLPGLNPLVERMAGRLRAELAATGAALGVPHDIDLLDLLLDLDVPVADPDPRHDLGLGDWAERDERRDLDAVAADPRFAVPFRLAADGFGGKHGAAVFQSLNASPGGRSMLTVWVRDLFRRAHAPGLPNLSAPHRLLEGLPADVLALGAGTDDRIDLATEIVRTLRGGLVGELAWPAFEQAVAEVLAGDTRRTPTMLDAWPYLIVAGDAEVRVVGPDGVVLAHAPHLSPKDGRFSAEYHFADGALLVFWRPFGGGIFGYWHVPGRPDPEPVRLSGGADDSHGRSVLNEWHRGQSAAMTLPVPGGGRTGGDVLLRPGGTALPDDHLVSGDGRAFWRCGPFSSDWTGFDPATGAGRGAPPPPALTSPGTRAKLSWLRPAGTDEATPLGVPVDGLLGWRVSEAPDGSVHGTDLAGRSVSIAAPQRGGTGTTYPIAALTLPGDDRLRALIGNEMGFGPTRLTDPDGVVTATDHGPFAEGVPHLPPQAYWPVLRARDPEGSAALRGIGRDTAAALLDAALRGEEELPALVRTLIPQVKDDVLAAGVAGVARFAAERRAFLDGVRARLTTAPAPEPALGDPETDPSNTLLGSAFSGLYLEEHQRHLGYRQFLGGRSAMEQLRALLKAVNATDATPGGLHLDRPGLCRSHVSWSKLLGGCAAIAFRAAAPTTAPAERDALRRLLDLVDALGLDSSRTDRWRRFEVRLDADAFAAAGGVHTHDDRMLGVLPVGGGAFLAFLNAEDPAGSLDPRLPRSARRNAECDFTALFHDPAGRFEVPAPYIVLASGPVGADRAPGWLRTFLDAWSAEGQAAAAPERAAEEFAELTGVAPTLARLMVAGLPEIQNEDFPSAALRDRFGVTPAMAGVVRGDLARRGAHGTTAAVVGALLPEDPARLWTAGPDVAAAAAAWNALVGRQEPVPEAVLTEGAKAVTGRDWWFHRTALAPSDAMRALSNPAGSLHLTRDLDWFTARTQTLPTGLDDVGFTDEVLVGTVETAGWLAHRLPAGDPLRAALPEALALVRARLAAPGMLLALDTRFELKQFRDVAGEPDESGGPTREWLITGSGWERYGAVIVQDHDHSDRPLVRTALLDGTGHDPYLALIDGLKPLRDRPAKALRLAYDPAFAALLADPGDPAAGERAKDGTWWPQDPTRSVPDLVAEVAGTHGLPADAAALYLMLLALPEPTDRNVTRWTGWKPTRLGPARAALAASGLVVEARRARFGRSLFLPGGWEALKTPRLPLETWKLPLFDATRDGEAAPDLIIPTEPVPALYAKAWRRARDGDAPRHE